jgi:hypothetical protein
MSLISAALLAVFGVARADTAASVNAPGGRHAPKCIDRDDTVPAGCVPSAPLAGASTGSGTSTDFKASGTTSNPSLSESRSLDAKPEAAIAASPPSRSGDSGNSASSTTTNMDQSSISGGSAQQPDTGSSSTRQTQ